MNEIFKILHKNKITPNQFYLLYTLHEKIACVNISSVNLETRKLILGAWITKKDESYKLTTKALCLLKEIKMYFKTSKKKSSDDLLGKDYSEKLKTYNSIFPAGKLPGGRTARVNVKNLEPAFKWFFDFYDYDWKTVFQATEEFVNEYSTKKQWMSNSQYFIRKQQVDKTWISILADYCQLVIEDRDNPQKLSDNILSTKVV